MNEIESIKSKARMEAFKEMQQENRELKGALDKIFLTFFEPLGNGRFKDRHTGEIIASEKCL